MISQRYLSWCSHQPTFPLWWRSCLSGWVSQLCAQPPITQALPSDPGNLPPAALHSSQPRPHPSSPRPQGWSSQILTHSYDLFSSPLTDHSQPWSKSWETSSYKDSAYMQKAEWGEVKGITEVLGGQDGEPFIRLSAWLKVTHQGRSRVASLGGE